MFIEVYCSYALIPQNSVKDSLRQIVFFALCELCKALDPTGFVRFHCLYNKFPSTVCLCTYDLLSYF